MKLLFAPFLALSLFGQTLSFDYDHTVPFAIQVLGAEHRGDVQVEDISFRTLLGGRTAAYRVLPPGKDRTAGALFVHWYNPESMTSNRTQFLNEAVELAKRGLVSLLVATPWSNPKFYPDRDVSLDYENSVQEVKDLMRDMDVLLSYPRVDPARVAYVGHDFGAMYGMVMTAIDQRASVAAFQAGNSRFGEWFLYNQTKLSAVEKRQVSGSIGAARPRPLRRKAGGKASSAAVLEQRFLCAAGSRESDCGRHAGTKTGDLLRCRPRLESAVCARPHHFS